MFALAKYPIKPLRANEANWVRTVAQKKYARGLKIFACYRVDFIPPVVTTWHRLIKIYNLSVWTGFDDYITRLEPNDYVGIPPIPMRIFGTCCFMRKYSTLLRVIRKRGRRRGR